MQSFIKFLSISFLFFVVITTTNAQFSKHVVVVNGGVFGTTNYANVSLQNLSTGVFTSIDTIYTTSVQDLLIDGQNLYVAAQDSIVKYDLNSQTRIAANAFGAPSTVKMALHGSHLLVGNWYEPWGQVGSFDNHFRIFDATTLAFVDSIPEVTKAADDFVVIGDYAYIAQNTAKTVGWGDTLGYLAVVDLTDFSFVRYDTLSTGGEEIGRLVAEGDLIYALNGSSNTISSYNTQTLAKSTQAAALTIAPTGYGPTAYPTGVANTWYIPHGTGICSYNLATNTAVLPNIVTVPGSFAFALDTFNNTFLVSHIDYGNQLNNKGRIYDLNGDSVGMFQVGLSPELVALISDNGVAVTKIAAAQELNYTIYPNPTQAILNIELASQEMVTIMLIDQLGQVVLTEQANDKTVSVSVENFAAGAYFVAVANEAGVLRTARFVKE